MTTPVTTTTETTSTTYTTTVTIEGTEANYTAITNDVESTITSSTGTTPIITTTTAEGTTLPQTGYSKWYQTAVALAACMTGIGGAMVIGSDTLKKKRR